MGKPWWTTMYSLRAVLQRWHEGEKQAHGGKVCFCKLCRDTRVVIADATRIIGPTPAPSRGRKA